MTGTDPQAFPEVASEAIVVVDLVESTAASNLFGWYAVGRGLLRDLRAVVNKVASPKGLRCLKSTGDGYLLTFANTSSAEMAAVQAVGCCFEILDLLEQRNTQVPEQRMITVRLAVHFGQVDVIDHDREGPDVSYAFRIEGISRASLATALNPIPPEDLPLRNYVLCSEEVAGILERRANTWKPVCIGLLRLKGFPGWREVFRLVPGQAMPPAIRPVS